MTEKEQAEKMLAIIEKCRPLVGRMGEVVNGESSGDVLVTSVMLVLCVAERAEIKLETVIDMLRAFDELNRTGAAIQAREN